MSLMKCPECGNEISDLAEQCPNCGFPIGFSGQPIVTNNVGGQNNPSNSQYQGQPYVQTMKPYTPKEKNSVLGILALIFSIIGCTFYVGVILAIIDLSKKDNNKKTCSVAALIISVVWLIIIYAAASVSNSGSSNRKETPNVEIAEEIYDEDIFESNMEQEDIIEENDTILEQQENGNLELSTDKEITFRDIPWGTSFAKVDELLGDMQLINISGEAYQTKSIDDITLGDYKGLDFEYNDINIIGSALKKEVEVAGYTTEDVNLYFAYIPNNGVLNKTEEESSLYGAKYTFSTTNIDEMAKDLRDKLVSTYGEPVKESSDSDIWGNKCSYLFWSGSNETELVLKTFDAPEDSTLYEDEIEISYIWLEGDKLLQEASDTLKQEAVMKERETYGNGFTDGL